MMTRQQIEEVAKALYEWEKDRFYSRLTSEGIDLKFDFPTWEGEDEKSDILPALNPQDECREYVTNSLKEFGIKKGSNHG
jgi:hypothetical protein